MRTFTLTAAAVLAAGTMLSTGGTVSAQERFVTIGTGGVTGVYYPTGGAIQRLVNRGRADHGIRVAVESTGGSVFNLNAIANGELDMGVAQSDWQFHAFNGGHDNFPEANEDLRAVFSIHGEPFTVLARADADIHHFEDLAGHRVNIGNPGSGQRGTMEVVMAAYGWDESTFSQVSELQSSEQAQALCDNNVDAIVFTDLDGVIQTEPPPIFQASSNLPEANAVFSSAMLRLNELIPSAFSAKTPAQPRVPSG